MEQILDSSSSSPLCGERQKKRIGSRESRKNVEIYDLINHYFLFFFFSPGRPARTTLTYIYTRHWWPKGSEEKISKKGTWRKEKKKIIDCHLTPPKTREFLIPKQLEEDEEDNLEHRTRELGEGIFLNNNTHKPLSEKEKNQKIKKKRRRRSAPFSAAHSFPCAAGARPEKLHSHLLRKKQKRKVFLFVSPPSRRWERRQNICLT